MEAWYFFIVILSILVIIENIVKEKDKKIIGVITFFFACFITGFRYEIGWDYDSYKRMFFQETFDIYNITTEPGFVLLIECLRNLGFDYQVLFIVTAVITYYLVYKGITFYKSRNDKINYGISAYLFFASPIIGYMTFSAVRQMLAVAMFFFSTKYIIEKKLYKYIICILVAFTFHYSAILLLPVYWVIERRITNKTYAGLFVVVLFMYMYNPMERIMDYFITSDMTYAAYLTQFESSSVGITMFFYLFLFIIARLMREQNNLAVNAMFLAIAWSFLFINNAPFLRMRIYFFVMFIILYQEIYAKLAKKYSVILLILMIMPINFLYLSDWQKRDIHYDMEAAAHPYKSAGNNEYMFNFNLLR